MTIIVVYMGRERVSDEQEKRCKQRRICVMRVVLLLTGRSSESSFLATKGYDSRMIP